MIIPSLSAADMPGRTKSVSHGRVTVDHQSLHDNTVTIRRRDDGSQERVNIEDLMDLIVGSRQELKAP